MSDIMERLPPAARVGYLIGLAAGYRDGQLYDARAAVRAGEPAIARLYVLSARAQNRAVIRYLRSLREVTP